jgi:hypothetical protein
VPPAAEPIDVECRILLAHRRLDRIAGGLLDMDEY